MSLNSSHSVRIAMAWVSEQASSALWQKEIVGRLASEFEMPSEVRSVDSFTLRVVDAQKGLFLKQAAAYRNGRGFPDVVGVLFESIAQMAMLFPETVLNMLSRIS